MTYNSGSLEEFLASRQVDSNFLQGVHTRLAQYSDEEGNFSSGFLMLIVGDERLGEEFEDTQTPPDLQALAQSYLGACQKFFDYPM